MCKYSRAQASGAPQCCPLHPTVGVEELACLQLGSPAGWWQTSLPCQSDVCALWDLSGFLTPGCLSCLLSVEVFPCCSAVGETHPHIDCGQCLGKGGCGSALPTLCPTAVLTFTFWGSAHSVVLPDLCCWSWLMLIYLLPGC